MDYELSYLSDSSLSELLSTALAVASRREWARDMFGCWVNGRPPWSVLNLVREYVRRAEMSACPRCEGSGKYQRFMSQEKPCAVCNGTGRI